MDYEKYIIDSITKMSGKYTPYRVFSDWIAMTSMAVQNAVSKTEDKIWTEREKLYESTASKYSTEELKNMGDMTGALALILEERFGDILGEIYMKSGCGSKNTGQFFTPYHLSYLTAQLAYGSRLQNFNDNDRIELNEPSTGGGGMIIAVANVMKDYGINYQRKLHVVAQDLDWNGVYMTYVQLSLLGIRAVVVQGDTLADPFHPGYDRRRVLRTPAEMGALL